jgi:hypothetical protein
LSEVEQLFVIFHLLRSQIISQKGKSLSAFGVRMPTIDSYRRHPEFLECLAFGFGFCQPDFFHFPELLIKEKIKMHSTASISLSYKERVLASIEASIINNRKKQQ